MAVLRARKLNPSSENRNPDAAVIVKVTAFPAAAWVLGVKKLVAPLIWAALLQPVLSVNERKTEALVSGEMVSPEIGAAAFASEPPVKLKLARVAA